MTLGAERARIDAAIRRLPKWLLALAALGTLGTLEIFGVKLAAGFLAGALAAWVNLRFIERAVDRMGELIRAGNSDKLKPRWRAFRMLAEFVGAAILGFVILRISGISVIAVFCGFLVCPGAVILEILYELAKYEHS